MMSCMLYKKKLRLIGSQVTTFRTTECLKTRNLIHTRKDPTLDTKQFIVKYVTYYFNDKN